MNESNEPSLPQQPEPQLPITQKTSSSEELQDHTQAAPNSSQTQSTDQKRKQVEIIEPKKGCFYFVLVVFPNLNLYKIKPYAENIKTLIQMLIGIILIFLIIGEFIVDVIIDRAGTTLIPKLGTETLGIVGIALVFSTAFELAYSLFTEGPDEAVEPLITGLAAVILVVKDWMVARRAQRRQIPRNRSPQSSSASTLRVSSAWWA